VINVSSNLQLLFYEAYIILMIHSRHCLVEFFFLLLLYLYIIL